MEYCNRCMVEEIEEDRILSEIAHSKNRSLQDLLRRMRYGESSLQDRAKRKQEERLKEKGKKRAEYEERLKQYEEELSYEVMEKIFKEDVDEIAQKIAGDELRKELEQKVRELRYQPEGLSQEDLEQSLEEYIKRGEIDLEEGKIKITPKGARKLARNMLRRILENLAAKEIGPHSLEEAGYGVELSISSRRYELGDEYEKIDFERTFLNALEGNLQKGKISLKTKDFQVYQEIHQTRLCSGLIIDESGSMSGDKSNAAMDTALALSELIRREPKDSLKVYLFSQKVREIPYYDILNASFSGGTTDIKSALRAFRKGVSREKGDKQAYLITDTEPNTEDGRYVGLKEATSGIIQEALYYRQAGITLNIIMLDQSPKLKELASIVAKRNLGRVFFTCPLNLGKIAVEDYLVSKRKIL